MLGANAMKTLWIDEMFCAKVRASAWREKSKLPGCLHFRDNTGKEKNCERDEIANIAIGMVAHTTRAAMRLCLCWW
jgi:hypothetical protein